MPPRTRGGKRRVVDIPVPNQAEVARPPLSRVYGRRVTASNRRGDHTPSQSPVATDDRVETPFAPIIHSPPIRTGPSPISREVEDVEAEVGRMGQSLFHLAGSQPLLHSAPSSASRMMAGSSTMMDGSNSSMMEGQRGGRAQRGDRAQREGRGNAGGRGRGGERREDGDSDGDGDCDGEDIWRLMDSHPGGPVDPEILTGFLGHVAAAIWHGEERDVLGCHGSVDRLSSWIIEDATTSGLIFRSGLGHLKDCMFRQLDMPLISAFVERWHPETNSFHLPFGEMTLTLHDVYYILQIPVEGRPLVADTNIFSIKGFLSTILRMQMSQIDVEVKSSGIKFLTVQDHLSPLDVNPEPKAIGYLFWLMGATLFTDKTSNRVNVHTIMYLSPLADVPRVAWGAATLSYLYRQLGIASRAGCKQMAGCLTLLQAWIYEYFPVFRPSTRSTWSQGSPHASRWAPPFMKRNNPDQLQDYRITLDHMTVDQVTWTPFGTTPERKVPISLFSGIIHCRKITEPYMPDRCLRQFGYMQTIPIPIYIPKKVYRGRKPHKYVCKHDEMVRNFQGWQHHVVHPTTIGSRAANAPSEAVEVYLTWFRERSHFQVIPSTDDDDDDDDADADADDDDDDDHAQGDDHAQPSRVPPLSSERVEYLLPRIRLLHPDRRGQLAWDKVRETLDDVCRHFDDLL